MTVFETNNIIDSIQADMTAVPKMDVYAIYLRKSQSDDPSETVEEVIKRHKDILTQHAARRGLYIGEIYQEVVSGENIDARKEFQRLINDCYAGKYRGILVIEITRLSRGNQGDAQVVLDMLKFANNNRGVLVVTPTKTYDVANNSDDEEYMEFELFMSRREYKMITRRMLRGKEQAIVEGQFMNSHRPYGYNIVKTKKFRTLEPNPEEAPIVKQIFAWTVKDNLTAYEIAKRLDAMGVPTYTRSAEWSRETIKAILTNPVYVGRVRYNDRMEVRKMVDGKIVKSRPRSNHTDRYMEYEGLHKAHALVDEETFRAVSTRFYSDRTKGELELKNPLAGILYCPNCNKAMVYQGFDKRPSVAPRYRHAQSHSCKVKSAVVSDVLDAVIHALKLYIEDFEMQSDNTQTIDEAAIAAQVDTLNKELRKSERILAKLFVSWEEETISDNEFVQRKAVHNERIASIKQQIEALEDTIPQHEELEERIIQFREVMDALKDDTVSAEAKNVALKSIIERIYFSRENNSEFVLDIQTK